MADDFRKTVPTFTVLKNGSILKNIFLLRKQNPNQESILLVGRHPHCNITLTHPSVSRHHLRIHSIPSLQLISVVDLSSVHGTWVSGKRIEPGVNVGLKEGDTLKIGGSSRVYELHWVPLSQAYDDDGKFVSTIYTIKEGEEEETNQDEKLETQTSDDDLECSNLLLPDKISPLKTMNQGTALDPEYFSSSCNGTELQESSSSKTDNENGEIISSVLVPSPHVVLGIISPIEDSDNLNESEDPLNLLGDNLSNDVELQNHGIVKNDLVSEVEDLSSQKTSNENCIDFYGVSVHAPTPPVVSRTTSATEIADGLTKLEDLNWLKDNLSNEFDLQSHGIIREDLCSVPNCSIFACNGSEVEHWIPWNIVNKDGLSQDISSSLNKSEDWSKWLRDNLSNEFEQFSHGSMQDDLSSGNLFDATKMHEKDVLKFDNGSLPVALFEDVTRDEGESFMLDRSGDNEVDVDCELELMTLMKTPDESTSVVLFEGVDSKVEDDVLNKPIISGEEEVDLGVKFESIDHEIMREGTVFDLLSTKIHEKDGLNQDISRSNENEPSEQQEFDNGSLPVTLFEDVTRDEDKSFMLDRSGENEVDVDCELMPLTKMTDASTSVVLFEGVDSMVEDDVLYKPIVSGEEEEDLGVKFESIDHEIMKEESVFDVFSTKIHENDDLNQDISRSNENEPLEQQEFENGSLPVALFEDLTRDEDESLMLYRSGDNEVGVDCELELMTLTKMTDESTSVVLFEGVDSKVEDDVLFKTIVSGEEEVDLGVKFESIDHELMKEESVFDILSNTTDMDQEQTLSPDILIRDEDESFMLDRSRDNEVDVDCELELMTQMKMTDESTSVVLFEGVDSKVEDVLFKPVVSGEEDVDLGVKFESVDHEIMKQESVFDVLSNETDMDQEQTLSPDILRAKEVHLNLGAVKNASVSMNLFDSLNGNELELFTPDKENRNLNVCSGRSLEKTWKEDRNYYKMSTEAVSPTVNEEKDIFSFSKLSSTSADEVNPLVYCEEVLLSSSEKEFQSSQTKMEGSCRSIICSQTVEKVVNASHDEKLERQSSDDDLECPDLSLPDNIHDSSLKTLSIGTSLHPEYFNSSEDTELERSNLSKIDNEKGESFSIMLVQSPLVVSGTIAAVEDSENGDSFSTISLNLFDSLDGNDLELFTPDKENKNPNDCSGRSLKKTWKKDQNYCTMSTEAVSPTNNDEKDIFSFSKVLCTNVEEVNPFLNCEEVLLSSSEKESQSSQTKMEGSCSSMISPQTVEKVDEVNSFINCEDMLLSSSENESQAKMEGSCSSIICPETIEKVIDSSHGGEKKRWTMIVDTNTLLHDESLKHLKLLKGLKGTRLVVPKIVIRELMDIKKQDNFLKRREKKVSLALKWIDECMANTKWWIHMEDEIVNSSEAESQVLETAICLHKEITDEKMVILSNDLSLKIKAMAEGIICEAAEEFRWNLVNPSSERFMWVGSSAIGFTWSSARQQKYHGCVLKGLKLLANVSG